MPLPSPHSKQSRKDFISQCMANDVMGKEFPDSQQRYAVCTSRWQDAKANIVEIDFTEQIKKIKEDKD